MHHGEDRRRCLGSCPRSCREGRCHEREKEPQGKAEQQVEEGVIVVEEDGGERSQSICWLWEDGRWFKSLMKKT